MSVVLRPRVVKVGGTFVTRVAAFADLFLEEEPILFEPVSEVDDAILEKTAAKLQIPIFDAPS